jgi:rhodanese-related sulfurtransferase
VPAQVFSVSEVKQLLDQSAQLVDVLGEEDFERDHLPGAMNIPLKQLDAQAAGRLDPNRPVLVYCNDFG